MLKKAFNTIKNSSSVESLMDGALAGIKNLTNSGSQYGRSYAAALTLLVAADFEFDSREFSAAVHFIQDDTRLREMNLTVETIEYFQEYTKAIKEVMCQSDFAFPIVQAKMVEEVRKVPSDYKGHILTMVNTIAQVSGPEERHIADMIQTALLK